MDTEAIKNEQDIQDLLDILKNDNSGPPLTNDNSGPCNDPLEDKKKSGKVETTVLFRPPQTKEQKWESIVKSWGGWNLEKMKKRDLKLLINQLKSMFFNIELEHLFHVYYTTESEHYDVCFVFNIPFDYSLKNTPHKEFRNYIQASGFSIMAVHLNDRIKEDTLSSIQKRALKIAFFIHLYTLKVSKLIFDDWDPSYLVTSPKVLHGFQATKYSCYRTVPFGPTIRLNEKKFSFYCVPGIPFIYESFGKTVPSENELFKFLDGLSKIDGTKSKNAFELMTVSASSKWGGEQVKKEKKKVVENKGVEKLTGNAFEIMKQSAKKQKRF
jgi:hypothetical protein